MPLPALATWVNDSSANDDSGNRTTSPHRRLFLRTLFYISTLLTSTQNMPEHASLLLDQTVENLPDDCCALLGMPLLAALIVDVGHSEACLVSFCPLEVTERLLVCLSSMVTTIQSTGGLSERRKTYSIRLQAVYPLTSTPSSLYASAMAWI